MKKLLVILLLTVYGFSASGTTLHLHYCCGKLKSIEWSPVSANECGEKHNMGTKPCCETKLLTSNKSPDEENFLLLAHKINFVKEPIIGHSEPVLVNLFSNLQFPQRTGHPPPRLDLPLFIQFCVFRI